MTDTTTHASQSFTDLANIHSELCAAAHRLHLAWDIERKTTGKCDNSYSDILNTVHEMSDRVYRAFRSHPDHPLNQDATNVPPAEDTTPSAPYAPKILADYVVRTEEGVIVNQGDTIEDFRGDRWTLKRVSRAPMAGKSAKVTVQRDGNDSEFYAQVFSLTVS